MTSDPLSRPAIGIMAHVKFENGEFKGQQGALLYQYLRIAHKDNLFACVFDPAEVDPSKDTLDGYVLMQSSDEVNSKIIKIPLQLPKVVYDQVLSRKYETAKRISVNRYYLRKHAAIFNDGYFNKWQMYEWLGNVNAIVPHVPKSGKYTLQNLKEFCSTFPVVFVKPIHGSLGRGIIKLIHRDEGWHSMIRLKTVKKEMQFTHDCVEVYDHFSARTAKTPYLLQEGIPLLELDNRPLDIRVLVQKNEKGEWKRTKTYIRLAAKGEFVSNLSTGGEAFAISLLKNEMSLFSYQQMRKQLQFLVKKLPELIEEKAKRTLGELGMDFGVDDAGQVYILEINSKPRKNIETTRGSAQLVERALERPLLYAMRLNENTNRKYRSGV
jgi:glutathione synthase/RimK-type ligase-like ATP-grasp enzyme